MKYQGSCHCGNVSFEVEGEIYGEGVDPKGNRMAAINLRCIEGIDLGAIPVKNFDGRSM